LSSGAALLGGHSEFKPRVDDALEAVAEASHLRQRFPTAGPRPGTGAWHQLYQAARGKYFIVEIF
jgi:hypothetical protein